MKKVKTTKQDSSQVNIGDVEGGIHDSNIAGRDVNFIHKISNFFTTDGRDEQRELRNRQIMLERVRSFWVEGVLEKSLHKEILIQLGKEEQPDAVQHPWDMQVQETADREPKPVSKDKPIIDIFEEMGRSLLILGAPGSGKTITLLELARDAIVRAIDDLTLPIPVVFNLSSWAEDKQSLKEWIVEELNLKYQIPRKLGKHWIENNDLLLLLDGLDEVKQESREVCVEAINKFRQEHGLTEIVVCGRTEGYNALSKQLSLQNAIVLQSLTIEQIDNFLAAAGHELAALRFALQEDSNFQELAESPLMLGIMVLAYQGLPVENTETFGIIEEQRKSLFSLYINRMLKRRRKNTEYSSEQTLYWLSWLSHKMIQHGQLEFFIEGIQPTWFSTQVERLLYEFIIGLIGGCVGFLIGEETRFIGNSIGFSSTGVIGGFIGFLVGFLIGCKNKIKIVESIRYSGEKLINRLHNPLWIFFIGLTAPIGIMIGGLYRGETVEDRIVPNQGLHQSVKNSIKTGLYTSIFASLVASGLLIFVSNVNVMRIVSICKTSLIIYGLPVGLFFGGVTCVQHFTLRLILSYNSDTPPLNLARFFNYAADRVFLRKIGGGYIFIHRMLLEYFASLYKEKMECE